MGRDNEEILARNSRVGCSWDGRSGHGCLFGAAYQGSPPVASYPGLTADVRARLGEMKVSPMTAEIVSEAQLPDARGDVAAPVSVVPKTVAPKAKPAEAN